MLKNGRVYIYGTFVLLIVFFNFVYELEHTSIQEAIQETIVILPTTFLFIWIIYKVRAILTTKNKFFKKRLIDPLNKVGMISMIVFKTLFISVLWEVMTSYLFIDDDDTVDSGLSEGSLFLVVLVSVLIVTLFVYFFENYLTVIENRHKMKMELSKHESEKIISKYLSLKKQLNPHFLFNSFNSLSALIHTDTHKADTFLQELSNVYRYNLDYSEELVVPVEKELVFIKSYMELQRIRFKEAIVINYQIDAPKMKYLIPPMTLELLVENAIKHNVVENENPLLINIVTQGDYIIAENNFQPRKTPIGKDSSLGIGLKNLKNQYDLIHKEIPTFTIENQKYIARIPLIAPNL
ncbi:sensor histidine kinase [Aquimarina spongiae]|uniref:Histidine kinase n=1 Tax=Aquimarina spongiae TaxID=570521 RepID=A0A1M6B3T2_9FLAO|nr:histidine kinase [Aquimarina spongiae]SHI43404.1 Histidine kinase [Aquimarina spongiae]